ncbi:SWIM zinc finger family protein [Viridibacterium curvum]|uniref:SWIM zinc finger family protein n=1 Tax=Viridibacterium curvum TaxID=1101404 RepID=A0ABP9QSG9_9RHOO
MQLGVNEVLQLSPDDASAKAAKGLVIPAKWPRLEYDDEAVWGECQGSGSKPYQVQVDKAGPAFKCSCPSRKFPCKHGLALLLLLAQHGGSFKPATPPQWVTEWLATRRQRAEKQAEKQEQKKADIASAEADPQAAAKREATRLARMGSGLDDLARWLGDRLRQGLATLPTELAQWEAMATRMVDAQLPGVAYRLRLICAAVDKGEGWPARVLSGMGRLQLLIEAFSRLDQLPAAVQADVRNALGLNMDRDEVIATGERVSDDWLVEAQASDEEGRLWVRRVWLRGQQSGRSALLLDYAHGGRRFERSWVTGTVSAMTLAYFPGNAPLRALVVGDQSLRPASAHVPLGFDAALDALSAMVAANPWQSPLPLRVDDGVPVRDEAGWGLQLGERRLPLKLREDDGWQLVAESGGTPLSLAGEWDGESLRPLSAWRDGLVWFEEAEGA